MSLPIPVRTGREGLAGGNPSLEAEPTGLPDLQFALPGSGVTRHSRSILLRLPCLALPQDELSPPPCPKTVSTDKPFSVLSGLGHSNSKVTNAKGNQLPQQFRLFRVTSSRCFQDAFRVYFSPASLLGSSKPPRLSGLFYRSLTDF